MLLKTLKQQNDDIKQRTNSPINKDLIKKVVFRKKKAENFDKGELFINSENKGELFINSENKGELFINSENKGELFINSENKGELFINSENGDV